MQKLKAAARDVWNCFSASPHSHVAFAGGPGCWASPTLTPRNPYLARRRQWVGVVVEWWACLSWQRCALRVLLAGTVSVSTVLQYRCGPCVLLADRWTRRRRPDKLVAGLVSRQLALRMAVLHMHAW